MREVGDVVLDRYRLEERIGRGASGLVFRATDLWLDEAVALKLLVGALGSLDVARREVRLARRVTHPNVARVYDIGVEHDLVFVTMELVEGETLFQTIARLPAETRMPIGVALRIALDVTRGLVGVHAAGVVHRDVKPANVLVTPTRAVLTDFGIALGAAESTSHDESGTPAYMAPEQIVGAAIDARTDVYSLGVLLFQLLTGVRPHESGGYVDAARRACEPAPEAHTLVAHLPRQLSSLVARMLAAEPDGRPSAAFVVSALEAMNAGTTTVTDVRVAPPRPAIQDRVVPAALALLDKYVLDATREAVALLESREDSSDVEVPALLARALLRMWVQVGGHDDVLLLRAEEMALRALSQDPKNATVHLALASVQFELGSYRAASRAARALLAVDRARPDVLDLAGRAAFELGSLEEGLVCLGEATRLGHESVEPWLDLVRLRALADPDPARVWSEIDSVSSRFGAQATLALRMRLSFAFRDPSRAAQAAREISANRTGAIWESSLPELEVLAGLREKTPALVTAIVERTRSRRPAPHRERVYFEVLVERLVALGELDLAHDWLAHEGASFGPVWLERSPSLVDLRGAPRFHEAHARQFLQPRR